MAVPNVRRLAWPGYLFALLLVVFPLGDLLVNVWPPRVGELQWRYGSIGLLSGFWLTPLFGVALGAICASVLEHRRVLRTLAVLSLIAVFVMSGLVVLFTLDWLQVRPTIPAEGKASMDVGSLKALVKHGVVAVLFVWFGVAGWQTSRPDGRSRRPPAPLLREPQ
ncbi:MAG: hypothetical protein OER21_10500 [Gemmatimonadota bacterium]|nr:hypothetical protein [Gemmatimonadota bacterium]